MRTFALLTSLLGLAAAAPVDKRASTWWYAAQDHSLSSNYYNQQGDIVISVNANDGAGLAQSIASNGRPDFTYQGDSGDKYLSGAPRTIYLPPGTYELDSTLYMYTDTVILGDPTAPPTIKPSSNFQGDWLISGGRGGINENNGGELHFSVMIKNVILDTTDYAGDITALLWRVAQNSALANVAIKMPAGRHTGIRLDQGSTISVAEVDFQGGSVGFLYNGHQQAELKGFTFTNTDTAIQISGGNAITVFANAFDSVKTAIDVTGINAHIAVVDCQASGVTGNFFQVDAGDSPKLNFVIENVDSVNGGGDIVRVGDQTKIAYKDHVDTYLYGNLAGKAYADSVHQTDLPEASFARPARLAPNGRYPVAVAPTYKDLTADQVVNVRDTKTNGNRAVAGDNDHDDTAALQAILDEAAASNKLVFFPSGVYKVTDTLTIPAGSQLLGEAWATITGAGDAFSDQHNPKAIVAVGAPGSQGTAAISDMRFTVQTPLAGAIVLQVNMKGPNPGDVALYNSLITVGGTADAQFDNCYSEDSCLAALYGLHLAAGSSALVSNFWSWVADHPADGSSGGTNAAAKYGVLIEATDGTWIEGLGSEHWWNAQAYYRNAQNVVTTFFQAETNYNQHPDASDKPVLPAPFDQADGDIDFGYCNGDRVCLVGPAEYFGGGANIYHYAAGGYWFYDAAKQGNMYVGDGQTQNWQAYGFTTRGTYGNLLVGGQSYGSPASAPGGWDSALAGYVDARESSPV